MKQFSTNLEQRFSQPKAQSTKPYKPNTKATQYARKHFIVGKRLPNGLTVTREQKFLNKTLWVDSNGNVWYSLPKWTVAKRA